MKTVAHDIFTCSRESGNALPIGRRNGIFEMHRVMYSRSPENFTQIKVGADGSTQETIFLACKSFGQIARACPWEDGFDQTFKGKQIDLTEHGWRASILD
jgi:hypothetical protein